MPYLELQNVSKTYGATHALEPLNLSLEQGELVTLLGPSGCGKTTLLRIVAGFAAPSSGRVMLEGVDLTHLPPSRREMGMVFQAYSLFPNLSAEDNVRFGLRVRGVAALEREKRVDALFELIGLSEARKRYPHQLSGGQQQRIALARALVPQPRVLLLDEPLSALDARVRVGLRDEIRRVQRETRTTALFVTHDQEEALAISDRVVVMNRGKIEQIGTPEDIYRRPATPFVAEFVGTVSKLEGRVLESSPFDNGRNWVEVAGTPLEVTGASGYSSGERVSLYLRPESLTLRMLGSGQNGELGGELGSEMGGGTLEVQVTERSFLGSITRLTLTFATGETLTADLQGAEAEGFPLGSRAGVHIAPDAPRVVRIQNG